jgi:hypothetical protein
MVANGEWLTMGISPTNKWNKAVKPNIIKPTIWGWLRWFRLAICDDFGNVSLLGSPHC